MAGEWIKWSKGLCRKPEVLQMSARLLMPTAQVAGTLMLLMEWLDESVTNYDTDGNANVTLGALPKTFIDGVVGVTGFAESMCEVGWLRHKDGVLTFVNAGRHNGNTAKARALTRNRVFNFRGSKGQLLCNATSVTPSLLFSSSSDPQIGQGELIDETPDWVKTLWNEWAEYHAERKFKPYARCSQKAQLKRLEKWGELRANEAVHYSIAQNYQGIFEERNGSRTSTPIMR